MSEPGLRHGLSDSEAKSASKSVARMGLEVRGWIGLPLGSILEV